MASTVWKGYISFGLVSVPVRLYAAAREEHVSFNQIHEACGSRIKQQIFCPACERVVERSELAKGYQVDRDSYVLVSGEELKTLEADSSEAMEITQFVSLSEVDPIYYQASYYSAPEDPGRRAYGLLLQAMEKLNVAAIAKVTLHQREQIVLMRPYHQGIVLHTLYFPAEVREIAEYGKTENHDPAEAGNGASRSSLFASSRPGLLLSSTKTNIRSGCWRWSKPSEPGRSSPASRESPNWLRSST